MNTLNIYGNLTKKIIEKERNGTKMVGATVALNRWNAEKKAEITTYIDFLAHSYNAEKILKVKPGGRVILELSPYQKITEINGKRYSNVAFSAVKVTPVDWKPKDVITEDPFVYEEIGE